MTAMTAEGAKPHGSRKTGKLEGPSSTSSLGKGGGEWSRAHPHPSPTLRSQDHPSPPAIVAKTTLRKALGSPALLGDAIPGDTWASWRALLFSILGEPLEPAELELYRQFTQRQDPPGARVDEFYGIVGRRGGKSRAIATLLCYLSALVSYPRLASGEVPVCLCLAPSQTQAAVVLNYARGILQNSPALKQLIRRETNETIELRNGVVIDVRSASFRRLRGQTCVAAVFDEVAFFHSDESANPDAEILAAVKPSLGTTNGILVAISSPHARRGVLYDAFKNFFGVDNKSVLVAKGTTRELNPSYPQSKVDAELARDPAFAAAEYLAEFRIDIEGFITSEAVEACIEPGVRERPFNRMHRYSCFVDPSGGASDSFTLAIGHKEGQTSVLDVIRERRAPFSPESVVEEFCAVLRQYQIYCVYGDRYAGEWSIEAFRKRGVIYEHSEHSKSQLYQDALPLINSRTAALLDDATLRRQLTTLERKITRGGKDSIDHAPGAKDDVANAACGALIYAGKTPGDPNFWKPVNYGGSRGIV
jgi:terminase large subunit-like protein